MKRKTITQRDPLGREQSSYEEEQDDGSGPFDSRTGALEGWQIGSRIYDDAGRCPAAQPWRHSDV